MTGIIDLSRIATDPDRINGTNKISSVVIEPERKDVMHFDKVSFDENEQSINNLFPEKILFTIKETADLMNMSYEFIRQQILKQIIPAVEFGDRKMINRSTIVHLLTNGVRYGKYN
ncbi:MAG TPA: hypothetical protein PLT92_14435 [Ignavibacteriaceae bacterium]|nr:hypothetical protein [Ignavibacteriaceae bacterium]